MDNGYYQLLILTSNKLAKGYFKHFINTLLKPLDYTRTKEIPALLDVSAILYKKNEHLRILDIGSPQILSLSLALFSSKWEIVYINPYDIELDDMRHKAFIIGIKNLVISNADIANVDSLKGLGRFDYIFSCSVFEHIHPENGGDITAAKNLKKLIRSGGIFSFSVPYYREAFNEYKDGDIYFIKGLTDQKTFFQRFYDEGTLMKQIIEPSGLRILRKKYIGERYYSGNDINKRLAFRVGFGKRALALGRLFNQLSNIFMEESQDYRNLKKPYLAIFSLGNSDIKYDED